jgi:hypothetical protein
MSIHYKTLNMLILVVFYIKNAYIGGLNKGFFCLFNVLGLARALGGIHMYK